MTTTGGHVSAFTAPEWITDPAGALSPSLDIYGLGGVLYYLLTGQPPFKSQAIAELTDSLPDQPPASLRDQNTKIPRELENLVLQCLQKRPQDRPATAAALAESLLAWRKGITTQPSHDRALEETVTVANATTLHSEQVKPIRQRSTVIRRIMTAIFCCLIGITAFAVYQLWYSNEDAATSIAKNALEPTAKSPPVAIAPFSETQAKDHQQAWASFLGQNATEQNSLGMTFRIIPPGEFLMGATEEQPLNGALVLTERVANAMKGSSNLCTKY